MEGGGGGRVACNRAGGKQRGRVACERWWWWHVTGPATRRCGLGHVGQGHMGKGEGGVRAGRGLYIGRTCVAVIIMVGDGPHHL